MTISVIFLLSLISVFIFHWFISCIVTSDGIRDLYKWYFAKETRALFFITTSFIALLLFCITYSVINNTFFHFKY